MKTLSSWKNGIISGFAFFLTVILLSTVYAAISSLSATDKVVSGSGLMADSWNKIVDNVIDLNSKTTDITSLNGNLGIGVTNPATKLEVNGIITAANVNQDPILSTQPATRPVISFAAGSWRYTGESITITVPSGPSRKYRVVNRQVMQYGVGAQWIIVISSSSNPASIITTWQLGGQPHFYIPAGIWQSVSTEWIITLSPGTYNYYVMTYSSSETTVTIANDSASNRLYSNLYFEPI